MAATTRLDPPQPCEVCETPAHYLTPVNLKGDMKRMCDECRAIKMSSPEVFIWVLRMLDKLPKKTQPADLL